MDIQDLQKQGQAMVTPSELIDATSAKVKEILEANFPDYIDYENGSFTVQRGSATVLIVVRPFTDKETIVEMVSNLVNGANVTPELMSWLLRKTAELHFGGFGLLFDDTVSYSYALPAGNLDPSELKTAIESVAIIADHYDDEIVAMAGGTLVSEGWNGDDA